MNRFGDIDPLSKRLPPVYGYHSEDLVSIERALESINSQIKELTRYIKIAKQYCHFPSEHGLSKDESAAIYIYTMEWGETTLYRVLNKALRSENRQALKVWFPYLKLFDTGLDKLPTIKKNVWRGISRDIGKSFTKNQILTWWSINSCSASVNVIKNFLGNETNATLFLIEAINGKKISGYTEYENEDEVIIKMGTRFRVESDPLIQSNGSCLVHLSEVDENNDQPLTSGISEMQLVAKSSNEGASVTPKEQSGKQPTLSSKPQAAKPSPEQYRNKQLEKIMEDQKNESSVSLSDLGLTHQDMEIVAHYLLRNNKTLTNLNLRMNQIEDAGVQYLADVLRVNKGLTELDLFKNQIGDAGAQYLAIALRDNKALTELNLTYNQIGDAGAQALAAVLRDNKALTKLKLYSNRIGDVGAQALAAVLRDKKTLTELELYSNRIGDAGAQALAAVVRDNKTLTTLMLEDNQIGPAGAQYLADALKYSETINGLLLHNNQIGDGGAQYLAGALRDNTTLTGLNLDNNQIGDRGVQYLADALRYNKKLKWMAIYNNKIGDAGAKYFVAALRDNETLREVYFFSGNNVSSLLKEQLQRKVNFILK